MHEIYYLVFFVLLITISITTSNIFRIFLKNKPTGRKTVLGKLWFLIMVYFGRVSKIIFDRTFQINFANGFGPTPLSKSRRPNFAWSDLAWLNDLKSEWVWIDSELKLVRLVRCARLVRLVRRLRLVRRVTLLRLMGLVRLENRWSWWEWGDGWDRWRLWNWSKCSDQCC